MKPPRRKSLHDPGAEGLFRKSVFVALGQGGVALLFVVYVFAARILGDAAFGEFSLGMAIAAVLFIFPAWGSGRYSAIIAARQPERSEEIFATYLGLTLPLSVLYFPFVGVASLLITGNPTVAVVALLLGADELVRELAKIQRLFFRVHDHYPLEAATSFAERGGIVLAASAALLLRPDPVWLAASFAGGRALGALATAISFHRRIGRIRMRFDGAALRSLFRAGTPMALRRGISLLTFRVDMLFLGALRPPREAGWYGSIYTIMDGGVMFPQAVTGSVGPTLSANHAEGRADRVHRLYLRGLKYLVIVGTLLACALATLAGPLVEIVYGADYAPAATGLTILALAMPFVFVRSLTIEVLDDIDLREASVRIFGFALLVNVVLNVLLVPRFGFLGAAGSTVFTEALLAASMMGTLRKAGYSADLLRQAGPVVLAIIPTAAVMIWLNALPALAAPAGGLIYLVFLTAFGTWDDKDRHLFHNLLSRVRGRSDAEK